MENFLKTFIHETMHALMDLGDIEEEYVKKFVEIVWKRFTKKQKAIIRLYLPTKPPCEQCEKAAQEKKIQKPSL